MGDEIENEFKMLGLWGSHQKNHRKSIHFLQQNAEPNCNNINKCDLSCCMNQDVEEGCRQQLNVK